MGVSWKRRYVQLGQMQRSLRMLHGEIRYTGAELPEAIDQIALRQEKPFSDFYHGRDRQWHILLKDPCQDPQFQGNCMV